MVHRCLYKTKSGLFVFLKYLKLVGGLTTWIGDPAREMRCPVRGRQSTILGPQRP